MHYFIKILYKSKSMGLKGAKKHNRLDSCSLLRAYTCFIISEWTLLPSSDRNIRVNNNGYNQHPNFTIYVAVVRV